MSGSSTPELTAADKGIISIALSLAISEMKKKKPEEYLSSKEKLKNISKALTEASNALDDDFVSPAEVDKLLSEPAVIEYLKEMFPALNTSLKPQT